MEADATLLTRYARSRDPDAFAELVRRYATMVYSVARRATGSATDAEDVCQSCFLELTKRADQITGSLAAYLHKAAAHRAADVVRNRATRQRHEHATAISGAAPMNNTRRELDAIVEVVDVALAGLPDELRLPLIEHYLRGQSQADVATVLGVNQSTVSRRLRDGVDRLRELLSQQGITASPALVPLALAREAIVPMPATLAAVLGKLSLSGAPAPVAAARPSHAMTVAIGALAAIGVFGIALLFYSLLATTSPATRPATLVPTQRPAGPPAARAVPASVALPDEPTLPGRDAMVHFDVLLHADDVAPVREAMPSTVPMAGGFFEARRGSAAALLDVLRLLYDGQRVPMSSQNVGHATVPARWPANQTFSMHLPQFWDDFRLGGRLFTFGLTWEGNNACSFRELPEGGLELNLDADDVTTFLQEYSTEPRDRRNRALGRTTLSSPLKPGEALVLLGDFEPIRGQHFVSVSVWHAYRATDPQFARTRRVRNGKSWVALGPHGTRVLADRAIAWGAGRELKPQQVEARWTKALDNGATVRLMAVAQPQRWPFCWWDADGQALSNDWIELDMGLDVQRAVAVAVERSAVERAANEKRGGYVLDSEPYAIPADAQRVDVWVGDGAYAEQRVVEGDTVDLPGGTVYCEKWMKSDNMVLAVIRGDLGPDVEVWLDAIGKDGKRYSHPGDRSVRLVHRDSKRWSREDENLDVKPGDVDHYVLRWRRRQCATFENFAAEPTVSPPGVQTR